MRCIRDVEDNISFHSTRRIQHVTDIFSTPHKGDISSAVLYQHLCKSLVLTAEKPRCTFQHFRILIRCPRSSISKHKLLFKSLALKAAESRCTFQDFSKVSQILHFQIQTLIHKLSFEGRGLQVHISGF